MSGSAIVRLILDYTSSSNAGSVGGTAKVVLSFNHSFIIGQSLGGSASVVVYYNYIYYPTETTIFIKGCSVNDKTSCLNIKFHINEIVYLKEKAECGLLRKIAIKDIIINNGKFANCFNKPYHGLGIPLYKDTNNSLHNQYDLVRQDTAVALAKQYYENLYLEAEDAIGLTGCD